ncbi:NAD(P)/FAD-dependent oxidoreductase [Pseudomonas batumici]|uniref:BatR n=2 Tax=Pseudomonas TaxID=286 RepID=D4NZF3_PSEFL|nr:FAD-binding oxidoreductase [Pseudomonas batumici]ADD82959.1 BatR [Pseudomonas fluorescens]KIH86023.1 BatR, batumin synthesis operon, FAD dependent oxidoreductase [Pseudomonas batumici]
MNFTSNLVWNRTGAELSLPSLCTDAECDHLIIGAGLAGLSAAYHILKKFGARRKVIVVDAHPLGSGASGRNSGMMGPGIGKQYHLLVKQYGDVKAREIFAHTMEALSYSTQLIRNEKLDCDLLIGSQFKVSTNAANDRQLQLEGEALIAAGFEVRAYDRKAIKGIVDSPVYLAGLEYKGTATINPMKLVVSLAKEVLAMGGEIYVNTRCASPQEHTVEANGHTLHFSRALLATNGFTPSLNRLRGRVMPISTSLMLSAPLLPSQRAQLGLQPNNAIVDVRRVFNYFRITPDHRLLFGGGAPFYSTENVQRRQRDGTPEAYKIYESLNEGLSKFLPQLANIRIEKVWSGTIGVTLDNFPVITRGQSSVDSMAGCCGHGLALSLAYGASYANWLEELSYSPELPWYRSSAPYLAPPALLPLASNSYIKFLRWADSFSGA